MSEALTGRKKTFFLFPISYKETVLNSSSLEAKRMLDTRLIYGLYPENEVSYNEEDGVLNAFEIKWKDKKVKSPNSFLKAYPNHTTTAVNQSNFVSFVDE